MLNNKWFVQFGGHIEGFEQLRIFQYFFLLAFMVSQEPLQNKLARRTGLSGNVRQGCVYPGQPAFGYGVKQRRFIGKMVIKCGMADLEFFGDIG
ncbi:hypothetical protein SDC9_167823 [bioreactor metagenome]|uniref:Uncharacterized protein n=1 Tax=bioreactor metagenome TaxID=1076179 RepID=A0A645G8M5_9ZZZZ